MNFPNGIIGHNFREIYFENPLLHARLTFKNLEINVEQTIRTLKLELEILERDLQNPQNFGSFSEIRKKIEKIKQDITNLESAELPPLNTLLLNGLQNNIDEIDSELGREEDIRKREELEAKKLSCINALSARQKPVTSTAELNDAADQIESDQRLINALQNGKLDEVDLQFFMTSDMLPFVDSRFEGEIKAAYTQMLTNDNVQSTLGRARTDIFEKADREWMNYKQDVEQGILELDREKAEIDAKMAGASAGEKESFRYRLKEIESEKKHFQAEIKDGRAEWTHRERTREEIAEASKSVLGSVKPEVLDKLKQLLIEAQAIRAEKAQEYLGDEFGKLEKQLADPKTRDAFSEKKLKSLEAKLAGARKSIVDQRISDPKAFRELTESLKGATIYLSASAEELNKIKENRPKIEKQLREDYQNFQILLSSFTPAVIQKKTEEFRKKMAGKKISEDSAIFRNGLNALNQLSDPESDFYTKMEELRQRLEYENIIQMDAEELLASMRDLQTMKSKTEAFLNNEEAELAHKTLQALETAKTPEEIRELLATNLGAEHLEYVSHAQFEKDHRKSTKKGHMVFQEEGGKWKIIIDESVFRDPNSLNILKKQLTHELLHLEFEKSDRVKAEVRKALIEKDPQKWEEIRQAFLDMARNEKKQPPNGKEWTDDDILSELYAMHNEMGSTFSTGKSAKEKLNNLLTGAGVGAAIGDIGKMTRGYEEGAKKTERGYEGGVEGGAGDQSGKEVEVQSKNAAVHKKNAEKIDALRGRLKELNDSEYISKVPGAEKLVRAMNNFNEYTDDLNNDLLKKDDAEVISSAVTARIKKLSGDLKEVEDPVAQAARKTPNNEIGILRKLWLSTSFNSIEDFIQMGKDAVEFIQRRHKRNVADHAAGLGMAIFGKTDLGREALARKHKAESEEVNEWKSRYEHLDAWHLLEELKDIAHGIVPNADQLKAILRILASKGRLNWRNQDLWLALNKLQSAVYFKPNDPILLHDPVLLGQKLHRALGEVYDYDEYSTLERDHVSAYTSNKQKYDPVHKRMQDKLTDRLNELLSEARAGEKVDPILFESIIEYCIKNGKSYAENIMFHLISGMAEGILGCDRGLALGDHLNLWPAIDWFPTRQPPYSTADWKKFCQQNFADSFKKGTVQADFKNFYWTEIQNSPPVVERVNKSVSERGWDHDWGRSIACLGNSNTAKRFLSGRSGQEETKPTAVQNAYVGAVQWIEENSKNPQFASKENFARMAGWVAMSEGILNSTAYRDKSKDINTRANEAMDREVPREAIIGNHANSNTRQHRQMASKLLFLLDPQFFGIFHGKEAITDEQKNALGAACKAYLVQAYPELAEKLAQVETIDQIFDRIDLIVTTMFERMSNTQFQSMLAQLAFAK